MSLTNHQSSLPYKPLPYNARDAVYDSLKSYGFNPEKMIVKDYAFSSRDRQQVVVNAIVFAHEIHRTPDYTSLTLFNPANGKSDRELVQILAQSAAPFHLIHQDANERFSFWFSNVTDKRAEEVKPSLIKSDISYDQLHQVLNAYVADLKPQRIIDVKQRRDEFSHPRFRETGSFQLSLWAIEVTRDLLVKHFGDVVNRLHEYHNSAIPKGEVTDIALQLLGATILSHTGALGDAIRQDDPSIDRLIEIAHNKYPNYFNRDLFERWSEAYTSAYKILTELRYSGFAPDMLTELYKEAYPDKETRRKLGRYDTPLYLTRRIWETIPVEFLPPEKRVIANMTCGWGSFLIAGYERLSLMIDMQGQPLRQYIHGNDKDHFTARLAGLGLLISTSEDQWHIDNEDAKTWQWLNNSQPNIIVGNPPFGGDRKTLKGQETRYQEADGYLERAIECLADGGYLAMLMPQSFVAAEASPGLRKKLLEKCDVQELWDLPIGLFPDATANTVVIFAQKRLASPKNIFPLRVRAVQRKTMEKFGETGIFTTSGIALTSSSWGEDSRKSKSLERPTEATQAIDAVLKAAYQLDDETFERLRLVAEWDTQPQISLDEQPDPNARWKTGGIVDSVDAENGTITLWLRNFDELQTVPISPVIPGWLLRPEVAFRTSIPRACVRQRNLANVSWGKFYPQDYTYLSEKELFDGLTELLNSPLT